MSELFAAIAASDEWQTMMDILPDLPFATWESFYATVLTTVLALSSACRWACCWWWATAAACCRCPAG